MTFTLRVDGVPVPKGRARVTTIGGFARAYTPEKTRKYEQLVAYCAREAWGKNPPLDGPIAVAMDVNLAIPDSWSKRKKAEALAGQIMPTGRADLDNYCKAVFDSLNEICYHDDSQIVSVTVLKQYSGTPGVVVTLEPARAKLEQLVLEVAA